MVTTSQPDPVAATLPSRTLLWIDGVGGFLVCTEARVTLGQAGGRDQLRVLYQTASGDARRAIIVGLFNARAEDDLIRIAGQERDARLRAEAISYLRLLGTPKAKAFLEKAGASR